MTSDPHTRVALIIEDDADVRQLLVMTLGMNGFTTIEAENGRQGVALVRERRPDLVTLDLNLPDIDGVEVCRQIRPLTDAYVVMITARQDEIDRLIGLEIGADDFVVKPFSPREVGARVNAMFRRPRSTGANGSQSPSGAEEPLPAAAVGAAGAAAPAQVENLLTHGPLTIDAEGRIAMLDGVELPLTRIEFDLLATLVSGPRRVWQRETLLSRIWGDGWINDQHLVEVHIRNLRKKLGEDTKAPRFIRTVRGVGYRMMPPSAA
ncbi:response regulator transcription factor [Arthrobacter agilis]|jgi:DNA-binding response OmpR family regulator|uniref:response regulator transcription factor n=1 Tax=Arthrobacter agilis TaxID=37921 RepID=UPI00278B4268|nr:response regulator transcription factor [Arthrobacter agilis]MDQ0736629.1 two-component system OmpR family response regulator [Arthrobacter agilis]